MRYQDVVDFVAAEPRLSATRVEALNPQYLMQIFQDVLSIGQATDRLEKASGIRASSYIATPMCSARASWPPVQARPRVVVIEWTEPLMAAGNWTPELVQAAGGDLLLAKAGQHSGYVTWLDVVAARPDVLIVAPCGFNLERSMVEARRLFELARLS